MARRKTYFVILLFVLALKYSFQDLVDHRGSEFILSFIAQHPSPTHKFAEDNNLHLSTFKDVQVRVQIPFLKQNWDTRYGMHAGDVQIIKLPGNLRSDTFTGKEKKGIRIIANDSITVHGLQDVFDKGEGFLGLPVDVLGKDYIVPTYPPVVSSIVQVVAKEDNTSVYIKLRLPDGGRVEYGHDKYYHNGDFINVTLHDLEVFQVQGDSDLSGTSVTSSKAIAVFSGNDCAMVPSHMAPCNHLVEQIPPISVWGRDFITSPTPHRASGEDEFHVLASKDNTNVHVGWQFKKKLSKGETYKIQAPWNTSLQISTSNPSLVVQYTSGAGSPSMSIMPPRQWASNDYTVYVAKGVDGYMNVVIDTSLRSGLRVKSPMDSVLRNWQTLAGGLSQVSLHFSQSGTYYVYHDNPLANFTAVVYGMTSNKMYSFPAGFKWELPINRSCSKTLTQGGDKKDNDCDGVTDEELANGIDDDGDGQIDEDLITPPPNIIFPNDYVSPPLLSCGHQSSNVADPSQPGFHPTSGPNSAQGMCYLRGKTPTISHKDNVGQRQDCHRKFNRVWTVKDACQNEITHTQRIAIITPDDPLLKFPADVALFCRDNKYLQPEFIGEVLRDGKECSRNVTITHKDMYSGDCSSNEAKLERVWTVKDKCRQTIVKTQVIKLMPKGSKRTNNYVTQFSVTSQTFSAELADKTSMPFKNLAANLENEMEETLRLSELGKFIVEVKVLGFSNGSVITSVLIKMDMQAQVGQQNLLYVMNDTLSSGTLGPYQVDPSSVGIKDFDECAAPDLNKCHVMAICTNTAGSYNCTCLDGYLGNGFLCQAPPTIYYADPPIVSGTEENVTLTCQARGLPEPTFTWIAPDGHIVNGTQSVYEIEILDDDSQIKRGKEIQEDGSLLVFDTRVHDQGIYKCIATNVVGQDVRSVNLTVREDIVEVSAAITLEEEVFNEELENKSSARYQEMEKNVKQELTALFQDIEGFERVDILGFVNGSVKVRFRVVVKVDKKEGKKPLVIAQKVGKTLRVSVQNGQIGSLKVKKTVELREVPPPPDNVQSRDVKQTEALITWSHPELYDMYAISRYSLQFKKFGTKKWKEFATTRGENHRLTNLEHGTAYLVRLKSENKFGRGLSSESLELQTEGKTSGAKLALAIVIPLLLLVILAIVALFVYRRWKKKKRTLTYGEGTPMNPLVGEPQSQPDAATGRFVTIGNDRYASVPCGEPNGASATPLQQASFAWREISRDRVILGKVLGEGEFGMVVKAEFTEDDGHIVPCAVKKLKRSATESDYKDLLNELEIMTSVRNHPNLVNLIGACSVAGPLMILVEFAENGSLIRYLREHRKQNYEDMNEYSLEISSAERLKIACNVADGMKHLAAMKCAHRDLAARNILLGEGMVAKVSDFGLSRDIYTDNVYEKKTAGKLPAKWMAVESLEQGIYTSQSDVWSFGVLLWEIETGGCAPYAGMVVSELLTKIKAGSRLEKPRYCTDWLYTVMLRCWEANPKKRPTFEELSEELHRMHRQETDYLAPEDYGLEPNYEYTSGENVSSA